MRLFFVGRCWLWLGFVRFWSWNGDKVLIIMICGFIGFVGDLLLN